LSALGQMFDEPAMSAAIITAGSGNPEEPGDLQALSLQ
jgi:hypothetical protein